VSTELIKQVQSDQAEKTGNASLQGSQLESFVVQSIELVMRFVNSDSTGTLHGFRVTSLNHVDLMGQGGSGVPIDFHARRKLLYPELHCLLGEYVSSVRFDEDRRLIISFANDSSLIFSNEPEEVFDPLDFNWSIDFDDDWERTPGVRSLSCVLSESGEAEFFESTG
jgi:hypothetical protein